MQIKYSRDAIKFLDKQSKKTVERIRKAINMSTLAMDTAKLIDMLPVDDQKFAYEFVKRLVLAWDPDFIKVTPEEAERIKKAEESGFVFESEIDWDKIGR